MGIRQTFQKNKKPGNPKKDKLKSEEKSRPRKKSKFYEESEMKDNVKLVDHLIKEADKNSSKSVTESELS